MAQIEFNSQVVVTQKDIDQLLANAFEASGGIHSWCSDVIQVIPDIVLNKEDVDKYNWYADEAGRFCYTLQDADTGEWFAEGQRVTGVIDGNHEEGVYRHLTLDTLKAGIERYYALILSGKIYASPLHSNDFDSGDADLIIQLAVFGTLVYG